MLEVICHTLTHSIMFIPPSFYGGICTADKIGIKNTVPCPAMGQNGLWMMMKLEL